MCGLVAVLSADQRVDREALERALLTIAHRGPDGRGVYLSPSGQVGLGHVRLSIVDREGGSQPISSEDGQIWAVVNGELYDDHSIRKRLELRGHQFRSRCDSEILVHLYQDLGPACLEHLRGEFAFVLYDRKTDQLFAARDRFGVKPLCFSRVPGGILLASEAKALLALGVPSDLDPVSVLQALSFHYPPAARTLFSGVETLEPGHYLLASPGSLSIHRYFDLDLLPDSRRPGSTALEDQAPAPQVIEAVLASLDEAVKLRLRADAPVAVQLSGGLDSASVLGLASRASSGPLHAFGLGFSNGDYDEIEMAKTSAARFGAIFHPVEVSQADLLANLSDAVYFSEGLAVNLHLAAKYILHREVHRAGFKVILTGEGADELFHGYAHLLRDDVDGRGEPTAAFLGEHRASLGVMLPDGPGLLLDLVRSRLGSVPSFLMAKATLGFKLRAFFSPLLLQLLAEADPAAGLLEGVDLKSQLVGRHPVDQACYLWMRLALAGYILRVLGDGTEMPHAVEGRTPFLDHLLFAQARRLPRSWKIRGGVEKWILREAVGPVVGDRVKHRRKHPLLAPPITDWTKEPLAGLLLDLLELDAHSRLPLFDRGRVSAFLSTQRKAGERSTRQQSALDPVFMLMTSSLLFKQRFGLMGSC